MLAWLQVGHSVVQTVFGPRSVRSVKARCGLVALQVMLPASTGALHPLPPPEGTHHWGSTLRALGCTLEGGVHAMVLLTPEAAALLRKLQEALTTGLVHLAGLNPQAFR